MSENKLNQFQWAAVEDLQLNAATTLFTTSTLDEALQLMLTHDYSQLPIVTQQRELVGYVTLKNLEKQLNNQKVQLQDNLESIMYPFKNSSNYELITLDTKLIDLEKFFKKNHKVAFITDNQLKFCVGVVTPFDLELFLGQRTRLNDFN